VSFGIGFEGSVGVDRSKMTMEGVPNAGASRPKITRGESNLGTRLGEKIEGGGAKLTCWGVGVMESTVNNGSQFIFNSLPNRKPMKRN